MLWRTGDNPINKPKDDPMRFCIRSARLDPVLGDPRANAHQLVDEARRARDDGVDLLLAPELAICGGPAQDLLLRPAFLAQCEAALHDVVQASRELPDLTLVVGHPASLDSGRRSNAASVIAAGRLLHTAYKTQLSADEQRYFVAVHGDVKAITIGGLRLVLLVGADLADERAWQDARQAGAQLMVGMTAEPWYQGKFANEEKRLANAAQTAGIALVSVNLAGAQDGAVHDGRTLAFDEHGELRARSAAWQIASADVALDVAAAPFAIQGPIAPEHDADAQLWHALVLGLRDYMRKNGLVRATLGLSGGLDSALVLALAVDALGPEQVRVLLMPSPYTAAMSNDDALHLAQRLGVRHDVLAITPEFERFKATLAPHFAGRPEDVTEENLQARIRGVLLMALSNKLGHLVLVTSNKSEVAVGYSTLYGDMCGGYAPIKDVYKTEVFRLARWRNANDPYGRGSNPIPQRIITRPPSAELRADQTDQDSLPPYEVLDAILHGYLEQRLSLDELVAAGCAPEQVQRVINLVHGSQYKRVQAAPGTRVTPANFDANWRYPLTHRFRG